MRIAVIGSGYVGLVSAACLTEIGHEVISVDSDTAKIAALERDETPIHGLMRTNGAAFGVTTEATSAAAGVWGLSGM